MRPMLFRAALLALAALCTPLHAQQAQAPAKQMAPVCANCHDAQWRSIDLTPHGAKNDAERQHVPGLPRQRRRAHEGPVEGQAGQPLRQGSHGRRADRRSASTATAGNRNLAFWTSGKHQLNEVTCSNCHSIHGKSLAPIHQQVRDHVPAQPGGHLRQLPPADPGRDDEAVASPDHRGQGPVQRLPQPARRDHAGDAEAADDQRPVLQLPRRQARSVRVQPPAGRGELRDLPQPARLGPRQAPERVGAQPVPGLPRLVAASGHDLRRGGRLQLPAGRHLGRTATTGPGSPTRA